MCGRWYVDLLADNELKEYYAKLKNKKNIKLSGEVFPSDHVMVIANSKLNNVNSFNMKWGYQVGKTLVFNARSETLQSKKLFVEGIKYRRCIIPANSYYEWDKTTKEKNEIKDNNSDLIFLAGIYRFEDNEPVCTILTKEASDSMKDLHPRMPVIIKKENINKWLSNNEDYKDIIINSINDLSYSKVE